MKRVTTIKIPDFQRVPTPRILTVKEPSAFLDNFTGKYLVMTPKHMDKFYKSIGMKDFRFVKALFEFDPAYCISAIQKRIGNTPYFLYEGESDIYAYSQKAYENLIFLLSEMGKFSDIWSHESAAKNTDCYLGLIDGIGIFVVLSHLSESVVLYDAEVFEESLFVAKNTEVNLFSDDFQEIVHHSIAAMTKAHLMFRDFVDSKLTWEEVRNVYRLFKIKSGTGNFPLLDDGGISQNKQKFTLSPFSVSDAFQWSWSKISDPKAIGIPYVYDMVLDRKIFSLQFFGT